MSKLDKLRELIGENAYLITSEINNRYLSGVDYTDGFLLITPEKAYLFADSRYIEVARNTASKEFEVMLLRGRRSDLIRPLVGKETPIGFEDGVMTYAEVTALRRAMPEYNFVPLGQKTEALRNVKEEYEKENIIAAQRIAEGALDHVLGMISPDMTEAELALELEYYMRRHGAEGVAFDTIAVSGSASSMPHGVPRRVRLEKGFLTMDFGAKYKGYCSDMTRTVCIGKPDREMKKVYDTVLKAQISAIERISAGKTGAEIDKTARDIIDGAGYNGLFGHSLGHGVGLYIHEKISLSPSSSHVLEKGNVVTVEPGIYKAGQYGVRIEDMVFVTENGCEDLTKAEKKLIII